MYAFVLLLAIVLVLNVNAFSPVQTRGNEYDYSVFCGAIVYSVLDPAYVPRFLPVYVS